MEPYTIDIDAVRDRIPLGIGDLLFRIFSEFFFWLQVVSLFISVFLLIGIIYSVIRLNQIRKVERELLQKASGGDATVSSTPVPDPMRSNPRWEHVKKLMESDNEGDWRTAIIEADIMLSDMVDRMQYPGETLGEQLKSVEKSDFDTIDNAWEAHKFRNRIAHEGSGVNLSRREARRVIALYESVFKEFRYVQ